MAGAHNSRFLHPLRGRDDSPAIGCPRQKPGYSGLLLTYQRFMYRAGMSWNRATISVQALHVLRFAGSRTRSALDAGVVALRAVVR